MEWNVGSAGVSCCRCGRMFGEREDYWGALFDEARQFVRREYCLECWKGPEDGAFSFWKARSRQKPAPPRRFVDDEVLLSFFERLCESEDESRRKFRFIMAVLLLRKRLLKETARHHDGGAVIWRVEVPRLGKTFDVRDEGLTEPEIAEILSEMGNVLNLALQDAEEKD